MKQKKKKKGVKNKKPEKSSKPHERSMTDSLSAKNAESIFERLFPNRSGVIVTSVAVLCNVGMWFMMYFFAKPDDYPVPLHYNIYQGIDLVDVWSRLYLIPILGAAIIIINYALSTMIYKKDVFVATFLNVASIMVQIILIVGLFWIFNLQQTLY